ncbi:MAG: hypothetical protein VKL60_09720 [Sphaerospermopsis sp.]|nr:hypothetical protein [Sphaerospermopsis sp.]
MGRRIIRTRLQANGTTQERDKYLDKLIKYIPADIISAWVAIKAILKSASGVPTTSVLWILFFILTGLTTVYIYKQINKDAKATNDKLTKEDYVQITISTLAFVVWVFATEEPFSSLSFYQPIYGSITLILFNLIIPLI